MSPDYDDMFTNKEMLLRLEAKIDGLRQDMVNERANMVSKSELDIHLASLNRDTERIERQLREELKVTRQQFTDELKTMRTQFNENLQSYRQESQEDLASFKNDINTSLTRLITLLGLVLAIVQFLVSLI